MSSPLQTTSLIQHDILGFDAPRYQQLQQDAIQERMSRFTGRLYLEIGGKFMIDQHASRVLPGFDPQVKAKIFSHYADQADILFCINYPDITTDRQLSSEPVQYLEYVGRMLVDIQQTMGIRPCIVINRVPAGWELSQLADLKNHITAVLGDYQIIVRYQIAGYPHDVQAIASDQGFGADEWYQSQHSLVLVTGAASNSGKMSTCMGQIYHDRIHGIESGYAKYETFPIRNIPLDHPVNLAYEAATIDIGDYNCIDSYHQQAYGISSVNYNRDVDAFELLMKIITSCTGPDNPTRSYRSPTDMGINQAGFAITDDAVVRQAAYEEILRRKQRYADMVARGQGKSEWITKSDQLIQRCEKNVESE